MVAYLPFHNGPTIDYGLLWLASSRDDRPRAFVEALTESAHDARLTGGRVH